MKTALTLSGSIRKGSFNRMLQAHMGRKLEAAGVTVNAISLGECCRRIWGASWKRRA
jgi:Predicted flavoprotein